MARNEPLEALALLSNAPLPLLVLAAAEQIEGRCPQQKQQRQHNLSLIHISEPTRLGMISYAVFCLKKKK